MRMSFKSVAVVLSIMTSGLAGAAPAIARDGVSNGGIVMVHDTGRWHKHDRSDRRDRYDRRDRRERAERRDRRDRRDRYERRSSSYERGDRRDRRDRRDNDIVIRLR